ncbi:MAG: response regulator transcription factor [Alkalinema sp. RU_4_3]|nr:response regulator transcription factor [Alkalinema sp. RU_4_3]
MDTEASSRALLAIMERMGTADAIDLVLLGLSPDLGNQQLSPFAFCRQVKIAYPNLPVLLLATPQDPHLQELRSMGVEGCCLRGSPVLDLVGYIRQIAAGTENWVPEILYQSSRYADSPAANSIEKFQDSAVSRLFQGIRSSSVQQIETALAELNTALTNPQMSALDRLMFTGRNGS